MGVGRRTLPCDYVLELLSGRHCREHWFSREKKYTYKKKKHTRLPLGMALKELAGDAAGETKPALARSFPAPFRNAAPGMFLLRCSPLMSTVTSRRPLLFA